MAYIHNRQEPKVEEMITKECDPKRVKEVFMKCGYSCEDIDSKNETEKQIMEKFEENVKKAARMRDEMSGFRRNQILDEVDKILSGDRRNDYGEASASFKRIADYWNTYLMHKRDKIEQAAHEEDLPYEFLRGEYLTDYDAAMMMILFKIAREENRHKRDNIRDIIGYAVLAEDLSILHTDAE